MSTGKRRGYGMVVFVSFVEPPGKKQLQLRTSAPANTFISRLTGNKRGGGRGCKIVVIPQPLMSS